MSDLAVTNITIAKDTATYTDMRTHYVSVFTLAGADKLNYYQVKYSIDGGVTYNDITSSVIFGIMTASYSLMNDSAHLLQIIPFAISLNTIATQLPSYDAVPSYASDIQNRFDMFDGNAKIAVYKALQNRWSGSYLWQPDCMQYIGNKLFGWKNGGFYLFNENENSFNTIFGQQYPQRISFPINIEGGISVVKNIQNIAIEGNGKMPTFTVLYSELPFLQITDLTADDWENGEGIVTASFFKDRLSGLDGSMTSNLLEGESVISQMPMCMIEFTEYNESLILLFLNIGLLLSSGHNQILK